MYLPIPLVWLDGSVFDAPQSYSLPFLGDKLLHNLLHSSGTIIILSVIQMLQFKRVGFLFNGKLQIINGTMAWVKYSWNTHKQFVVYNAETQILYVVWEYFALQIFHVLIFCIENYLYKWTIQKIAEVLLIVGGTFNWDSEAWRSLKELMILLVLATFLVAVLWPSRPHYWPGQ